MTKRKNGLLGAFAGLTAPVMLGMATPSNAVPVSYDFSIDVVTGALAGSALSGSFSFDDSLLLGPDLFDFGGLRVLDSFDFSFGGFSFDVTDADMTLMSFKDGELDRFLLAGAPSGFNRISTLDGLADFSIVSDEVCFSGQEPFTCPFAYDLSGSTAFGYGTFAFERRVATVAEPASVALLAAGLLAVGLRRRALRPRLAAHLA